MPQKKTPVTAPNRRLQPLDEMLSKRSLTSRNQASDAALTAKLQRSSRTRLARECAKLDPHEEKGFAEEGLGVTLPHWPEY